MYVNNKQVHMIAYDIEYGECSQIYNGTDVLMVDCGAFCTQGAKRTNHIVENFTGMYQNRHVLISNFERNRFNGLFMHESKAPYIDTLYLPNYCFSTSKVILELLVLLFLFSDDHSPSFALTSSLFDLISMIERTVVNKRNVVALKENGYFYSASNKYDVLWPNDMRHEDLDRFIPLLTKLREMVGHNEVMEDVKMYVDTYHKISVQVTQSGYREDYDQAYVDFNQKYRMMKLQRNAILLSDCRIGYEDLSHDDQVQAFLTFMSQSSVIVHSDKILFFDDRYPKEKKEDIRKNFHDAYQLVMIQSIKDPKLEPLQLPQSKDYIVSHVGEEYKEHLFSYILNKPRNIYGRKGQIYCYDFSAKEVIVIHDANHDVSISV